MKWLRARGLHFSTVRQARLGFVADQIAVNIPYLNPDGSVRMNRLRYLHRGYGKYWTPPGCGTHLYQVGNTATCPQIWITEGEFDALILTQMGLPSVACAGTQAFKPEWKYLFAYSRRVTVVADGDESGLSSARRTASFIGPFVDDIRVVDMPEGMDVTDLYLKNPEQLKALVR
jgi:Toprim-like